MKQIYLIIFGIILFFSISFGIYTYINSQSDSIILSKDLNNQVKQEHLKIEKLSKEVNKYPDNYILYLQRADAKFKKQEYFSDFVKIFYPYNEYPIVNASDIVYDLNKAKELNPNVDINLTLGIINYKRKQYTDAIKSLTSYIDANQNKNDTYLALYYRALCYDNINISSGTGQQVKHINNAISDLNKSIQLNPYFSRSYTALANIYNFYIDENEKAFQYYDKAIDLNNNDIENYLRKIFELSDTEQVMPIYYDAINIKNGKYCALLYFTMNWKMLSGQQKKEIIKNQDKAVEILSKAVDECKYCIIPKEFEEDYKWFKSDVFSNQVWNSLDLHDIRSAKKYYRQCKKYAKTHSYGDSFCGSLLDDIKETEEMLKAN